MIKTKTTAKIQDIIDGKIKSPLDIAVIPNYMGINLCCVDSIEWVRRDDNQLETLTINFIPAEDDQG